MFHTILLTLHVFIALLLIGLILLQPGKSLAIAGTSIGSTASQTLFGSQGSDSFLVKLTGCFGFLFFFTSLVLGYLTAHPSQKGPIQNLATLAEKQSSAKALHGKASPGSKAGGKVALNQEVD